MKKTKQKKDMIDIFTLKPHQENDKLLPSLSNENLLRLKERIKHFGFTEEVEITKDNILLDGHHRIKILKDYFNELNIEEVPYRIVDITKEEEASYIISKNFDRRQLLPLTQSYLRGKYYNEVKKKVGSNQFTDTNNNSTNLKTSEIVAKKYGTSASTIEKDGRFVKKCNELLIQADHDFVFSLLNGKVDANKNAIIKLASMPEDQIKVVFKHFKSLTSPYPSLKQIINDCKIEKRNYTRIQTSFSIKREFIEKLQDYCNKNSLTKDSAIEKILQNYFKRR